MRLIMRAHDNPANLGIREELMDAHLGYLAEHQAEILAAGSLREDASSAPIGALWILEVESLARAKALIESDPFYLGGLRAGYELLHWSKAFPHSSRCSATLKKNTRMTFRGVDRSCPTTKEEAHEVRTIFPDVFV